MVQRNKNKNVFNLISEVIVNDRAAFKHLVTENEILIPLGIVLTNAKNWGGKSKRA